MPVVFFAVAVAAALAFFAGSRYLKNAMGVWADAARELGLEYRQRGISTPYISGRLGGIGVEVDIRRQSTGKSNRTFTRYRMRFPSSGFDFRIARQTGFSRITKLFGSQDVEVGDGGFDDAFVVKTADEDRLRMLLTPGLRGVLLRTAAAYPGVEIEDDQIFYERQRFETSRDVIVSTVRRLVDTAEAVTGERSPDHSASVVGARERGELADVAASMRTAAGREAAGALDEELVALDTLATAGEHDSAREHLKRLELTVPADPDVMGWKERLEGEPKHSAPAVVNPDAAALAEEIFAGNALSFESKDVFDEKYRGAEVHWTGKVKSADPGRGDPVLGPKGGTRMIVTVATIAHDLYGNTEIDAVLNLPPGPGLDLRRGHPVSFGGTLTAVDPLVRNLFVADAALE